MGNFRIEIDATGPHGDRRDVPDGGDIIIDMYSERSVDRVAFEAVWRLTELGCVVNRAVLVHWPGAATQVLDDVLHGKRHGQFQLPASETHAILPTDQDVTTDGDVERATG